MAALVHAYEHLVQSSGEPSFGFLLWAMVPYGLCLALSTLPATRVPVIAGAAFALTFDLWGHYAVFVKPQGSTAALGLLFIPLWNTIIVVPVVTLTAWLIMRRRRSSADDASSPDG